MSLEAWIAERERLARIPVGDLRSWKHRWNHHLNSDEIESIADARTSVPQLCRMLRIATEALEKIRGESSEQRLKYWPWHHEFVANAALAELGRIVEGK